MCRLPVFGSPKTHTLKGRIKEVVLLTAILEINLNKLVDILNSNINKMYSFFVLEIFCI
jgi:hypothetical protein